VGRVVGRASSYGLGGPDLYDGVESVVWRINTSVRIAKELDLILYPEAILADVPQFTQRP
jgi:hypothetical protein